MGIYDYDTGRYLRKATSEEIVKYLILLNDQRGLVIDKYTGVVPGTKFNLENSRVYLN